MHTTHDPNTGEVRSTSTAWPRHRSVPDVGAVARHHDLVTELGAIATELGVCCCELAEQQLAVGVQ